MEEITSKIIRFRNERNWKRFHTPENLAKSISIEAAELLECFQWPYTHKTIGDVSDEIADVAIYLLTLCYELNIDIVRAIEKKIEKNGIKYPVKEL